MSRLSETKVGAIVIIAILILSAVGYYIFGPGRAGRAWPLEIIFEDARGLTGGEPVRMAGVQIGIVDEVSLAGRGKASVKVLIQEGIPLYDNYIFTVSSGALVPERYVDVKMVETTRETVMLKPGEVIVGLEQPGLPEIMNAAFVVLTRLEETATSIRGLVGDPETSRSMKQAILHFEKTTQRAAAMMLQLERLSREARPELTRAIQEIAVASREAQEAISYLSERIHTSSAPDDLESAIAAVNRAAASLDTMLSDTTLQNDIKATLANTRQMSDNLRQASEDVKTVTGEVRQSAPRIKSIIESADSVMSEVDDLKDRLRPPEVKPSFDFLSSSDADRSLTDVKFDLSFPANKTRFFRLGVADVGEENEANLQAGRRLGGKTLRYGLVRSKLGAGIDLEFLDGALLSVDMLDPNDIRADVTLEYPFAGKESGWGLIFGVRDGFGEDLRFVGARFGD